MPDEDSSSRDSFPRITKDAWNADRSAAFMTWMTTISVLVADTKLEGHALSWTILTDPVRQKADSTFPAPTNAARREAHRAGQIRLLRLCEVAFRDYLPSIIKTYTVDQYSDAARVDVDSEIVCRE